MRRLTNAFIIVCTAAFLVACGDAGDHFGEFRKNPNNYPSPTPKPTSAPSATPTPTPTPHTSPTPTGKPTKGPTPSPTPSPSPTPTPKPMVKRLSLSMPATPNPLSPGTFTLVVNAYGSNGALLQTGTSLIHPINLSSNSDCSISFLPPGGGSASTFLQLVTVPGTVGVEYTPPSATCTPPSTITILAFNQDASPTTAKFAILGGTATVGSISLSMLSAPNPLSQGVYPFFVTYFDTSGKQIPFGETLLNPITLSSNASCATTFGTTANPNTYQAQLTVNSTQTQVYMQFNPQPSCTAPSGNNVIVTGIGQGINSATYTFPY